MERNLKDYAFITLKGLAMGAADVVPGVSGGTIAFISGIYEELITTISNVNLGLLKTVQKEGLPTAWKVLNGNFILALLLGIAISVVTVMKFMSIGLERYPIMIWSFFFGLVLSSIILVGKQIKKWNSAAIIAMIVSAAAAYYITLLPPLSTQTSSWFLFISGALAICAMILPGISGAFILVLLGSYKTIVDAVHAHEFKTILIVGLGAIVGLLSFSKVLKWLFNHHENLTLAILTGFIVGSLNKIWPWKKILETVTHGEKTITVKDRSILPTSFEGDPELLPALALMLFGFISILLLEKIAQRQQK